MAGCYINPWILPYLSVSVVSGVAEMEAWLVLFTVCWAFTLGLLDCWNLLTGSSCLDEASGASDWGGTWVGPPAPGPSTWEITWFCSSYEYSAYIYKKYRRKEPVGRRGERRGSCVHSSPYLDMNKVPWEIFTKTSALSPPWKLPEGLYKSGSLWSECLPLPLRTWIPPPLWGTSLLSSPTTPFWLFILILPFSSTSTNTFW